MSLRTPNPLSASQGGSGNETKPTPGEWPPVPLCDYVLSAGIYAEPMIVT